MTGTNSTRQMTFFSVDPDPDADNVRCAALRFALPRRMLWSLASPRALTLPLLASPHALTLLASLHALL
tara:strand:- start:1307 stop:1513 length:207 start_codon:yes stop_codon:yes gene_type:complete